MTLAPNQIVAGRYRIEEPIGEGGMGIVYRVRHLHTDEALAMKVLHPHVLRDESAVERFRREARAPARIGSEHVARVTDADTAPELSNAPFYVMELLRGTDLERLVNEHGALAAALAIDLLTQAARALDKAHAMGIVHRDLKPENLFLLHREDGTPLLKLLDFGIARIADDTSSHKKTQAGYVFGTPAYMAPEQATGDISLIGPQTDVWALGLVAFKLLTGFDFWNAQSTTQLIAMTLSGPIPAPSTRGSSWGAPFDDWFARCVTRVPSDRFDSAGTAIDALAHALGVTRPAAVGAPLPLHAKSPATSAIALETRANRRTTSASPMLLSRAEPLPRRSSRVVIVALAASALIGVVAVVVTLGLRFDHAEADHRVAASHDALAITDAAPSITEIASPALPAPDEDPNAEAEVDAAVISAAKEAPARPLTPSQKQRLDVLQRLCAQGTFTPEECRIKQSAIGRER